MDLKRNNVVPLIVLVFGQMALTLSATTEPTYMVYFPRFIRPGFSIQFVAEILKHINPIKLTATLSPPAKELELKLEAEISQGESKLLTFADMIPIDYDGTTDFEMTIIGVDTVTNETIFQNTSSDLSFKRKAVSIFIQTDKGIYKRSQTIKFRAVVVTPDLLPYDGEVSFKVTDPEENIVFQQKNVKLVHGVAGSEFTLNRYATFGNWKITFIANEYEKSVTVSVEEYKLPKFEVEVTTDETYLHQNSEKLSGKVTANFTFGQPVKSNNVDLVFELVSKWSNSYYYWSYYGQQGQNTKFTVPFKNFNGRLDFSYTIDELQRNLGLNFHDVNLQITAFVTDKNSLVKLNGSVTVDLVSEYSRLKVEEIFVPKTMKPGLQYTAYMKISQHDSQPISAEDRAAGLKITIQTTHGTYYDPQYTVTNTEEDLTIQDDGMIVYNMTGSDADYIYFSVKSPSYSLLAWSVQKFHSPSGMYIKLATQETNLKPGDDASLAVSTTTRDKVYTIMMIARGKIVRQEMYTPESYEEEGTVYTFPYTFTTTKEMSPSVNVMIFFMGPEGDIVSDSVTLLVEYTFDNDVKVQTSVERTETGKPITITVETSPNSLVALRAIDRSVILQKEGNDITSESIIDDMDEYGTDKQHKQPRYWWFHYLRSIDGANSREVFKKSGVIVFTDAAAFLNQTLSPSIIYEVNDYEDDEIMFAMADNFVPEVAVQSADAGGTETVQLSAPAVQTRKNFPETWIWQENEVGSNGSGTFSFILPDTATTWEISAFAVSDTKGLAVSDTDPQIIATRDFFISLDLPLSMVSGEELVMRATVYNFLEDSLNVVLTLEESEWYNVTMTSNDTAKSGNVREITVPSNDGKTESFTIQFLKPGNAVIMINALSEIVGDRVEKKILVKPEGIRTDVSQSALIERSDRTADPSIEEFTIGIPDDAVTGSVYGKISVSGDVMGNAMNNLGNLLKMPYGCGEQNMLNFAPDVFISLYLKAVNRLDGAVEEKSRRHIQKGYYGELRYRRNDSSFSAFGNSDPKGSTWLTAFVTKCFIYAMQLREDLVDVTVIDGAIDFLLSKQDKGAFLEHGLVRHVDMQGGSGSRKNVTMTAYVLVTMTEGGYNVKRKELINAIEKAKQYLEGHVDDIEDTFALAITTYALALSGSEIAASQMDKLEERAKTVSGKDNLKYWVSNEAVVECQPWEWDYFCNRATSSSIEITAYALLTLMRLGRTDNLMPIVRWLVKQRNSYGGYSSTQDTVMGIQALSVYAGQFSDRELDVTLSVAHTADPSYSASFSVNGDNSIILQTHELPSASGNVSVSASGVGFADIQVSYLYNLPVKDQANEPFTVDITVDVSNGYHEVGVEVCASINPNGESSEGTGMFIVILELPSGYSMDDEYAMIRNKNVKLVELDGDEVTFYFDKLDVNEKLCFEFDMVRYAKIGLIKPQSVRASDYYKPNRFSLRSFAVPGLADLDMCKVCGSECYGCPGGSSSKTSFSVLLLTLLSILTAIFLAD